MSFFNIHLSSPFPITYSNFLASYTIILPGEGVLKHKCRLNCSVPKGTEKHYIQPFVICCLATRLCSTKL
jgi:hypothetical protein